MSTFLSAKGRAQLRASPWGSEGELPPGLALDDYPGTLLLRVGLAIQQEISASYAREQGLAVTEWRLLARLNADGPMRLPDLCRALALDKPYASRLLRSLGERKLVSVKKDPEHGLRLIVGITAAGRAIARKLLPRMHETQSELIGVLDGRERAVLYSALRKLQAAIPECRARADRAAVPAPERKTP